MANNRLIRIFSFFVALWYIISVTGFNVHVCSHSGNVSFSISSENVHCGHHSQEHEEICICGEHHHPEHGPAFTQASCCSDYLMHIDAVSLLDDSDRHIFAQSDFVAISPYVLLDADEDRFATYKKNFNPVKSRPKKSVDVLSLCSVWRL